MLTRRTGYVIILLSQGKKTKIEIESETEIKIGYWYLDNHPLGKGILKSISRWEIKNWNQYLDNHPCGGVVSG